MAALRVRVFNRMEAIRFKSTESHVWVSIHTPGDPPAPINAEAAESVYRLCIHDLDKDPGISFHLNYGAPALFTEQDADGLARWIHYWFTSGIRLFIAHCDSGMSRSGAVAQAMETHYDALVWAPRTLAPNNLIYRLLLRALHNLD